MSVNSVTLIGRVGKDIEAKDVNGAKCATFSLALSEKYKDRNGELQEHTEWLTIVTWRNIAEVCEKYVRKGDQICVLGKIRTRSYEVNGDKRYVTEIIADRVELLGSKREGSDAPAPAPAPQPQQRFKTTPLPTDDDDLPEGDGLPFN